MTYKLIYNRRDKTWSVFSPLAQGYLHVGLKTPRQVGVTMVGPYKYYKEGSTVFRLQEGDNHKPEPLTKDRLIREWADKARAVRRKALAKRSG
ncbi:MAG: hypothetical protein KGI98_16155 [Euryarchaeota archaeon]|nr:hypothetical protein [Euryarchaeota archaeon]MDE1879532.1 hypothetical protein [Euryarchaeota archaeon]